MRAAICILFCFMISAAFAQDQHIKAVKAYGAWWDCATGKAKEFAALEGSMTEIANAALGACLDTRRKAQTEVYFDAKERGDKSEAAAASLAISPGSDQFAELLAIVAEARLQNP